MLYRRTGFPEEDEIVLCKVTEIFPNSIFVELLEYRRQGMVHISEIAPGRIRNLREYVSLGREIVCKVLRLDREKGHIDLSLRRVNSTEREQKLEDVKQELKAESLIATLSKKLNAKTEELYRKVTQVVLKEYSYLYLCFKDLVTGEANLERMGLDQPLAEEVTAAVLDKFKPEKIFLKGEIRLQTYAANGLGKIRSLLAEVEKVSSGLSLSYLGGGRYRLVIEDVDYKPAEKKMEKVEELVERFKDRLSTASLVREKE